MSIEDVENKLNSLMKQLEEKIALIDDKSRYRNLAVEYAIKCVAYTGISNTNELINMADKIENYIVNGTVIGNKETSNG